MPRAVKCRRVCAEPRFKEFAPARENIAWLSMTLEELEAIRLCDYEGLEQEEAAQMMAVSRGTFQRILYAARKRVAEALCTGKGLRIQGGNYQLASCQCNCSKKCQHCRFEKQNK